MKGHERHNTNERDERLDREAAASIHYSPSLSLPLFGGDVNTRGLGDPTPDPPKLALGLLLRTSIAGAASALSSSSSSSALPLLRPLSPLLELVSSPNSCDAVAPASCCDAKLFVCGRCCYRRSSGCCPCPCWSYAPAKFCAGANGDVC